MYPEDELLPLSALQHFLFCRRQCALIHIEQQWKENFLTAEGRIMHDKVHNAPAEKRKNVRTEYGMYIRSSLLGVAGMADVVEFHRQEGGFGRWRTFPVEYKRGGPKTDESDRVQLCAQAMCLEEMLHQEIGRGAIYYGKTHRRLDVVFDGALRKVTTDTAVWLHDFIQKAQTPPPVYGPQCDSCSLLAVCLPKVSGKNKAVAEYLNEAINNL